MDMAIAGTRYKGVPSRISRRLAQNRLVGPRALVGRREPGIFPSQARRVRNDPVPKDAVKPASISGIAKPIVTISTGLAALLAPRTVSIRWTASVVVSPVFRDRVTAAAEPERNLPCSTCCDGSSTD